MISLFSNISKNGVVKESKRETVESSLDVVGEATIESRGEHESPMAMEAAASSSSVIAAAPQSIDEAVATKKSKGKKRERSPSK